MVAAKAWRLDKPAEPKLTDCVQCVKRELPALLLPIRCAERHIKAKKYIKLWAYNTDGNSYLEKCADCEQGEKFAKEYFGGV